MYEIESFQRTLDAFASILRKLEIRFHLTGGVTSAAYGEPRMTQDIDLVIDPVGAKEQLDGLIEALNQSPFLFDESLLQRAVAEGGLFQLLDEEALLKLDVYPREMIPGELGRSSQVEVFAGKRYPIVSRVDAVVSKLMWVAKGSHKSRRDCRILFQGCSVDERNCVHQHAKDLGLATMLAAILDESDDLR